MRLILTIIMIIPSHRHHLQGEKTFGIHCERGWGPAECVVAHLEQTVKIVMMVHDYRSYQRWPFQDSGSSLGQLQWWWVGAQLHPPQPGRQGGEEQRGPIPNSKLCELIYTSTLYSSFSHSGGNSFSSLTLTWISLLRGKMVILCF